MGTGGTEAATLTGIRVLCYTMLAWGVFYLAMSMGKWYEEDVLDDQLEYKLNGDLEIRSSYNQRFLFLGLPFVLSAALGGVYEAIWKRREINAKSAGPHDGETTAESPGVLSVLHSATHYKFRPLGKHAP